MGDARCFACLDGCLGKFGPRTEAGAGTGARTGAAVSTGASTTVCRSFGPRRFLAAHWVATYANPDRESAAEPEHRPQPSAQLWARDVEPWQRPPRANESRRFHWREPGPLYSSVCSQSLRFAVVYAHLHALRANATGC